MAVAKRTRSGHAALQQMTGIAPAPDASPRRRLLFPAADLLRWPHLPAFWPEHQPVAGNADLLALPEGRAVPPDAPATLLRYAHLDAPVAGLPVRLSTYRFVDTGLQQVDVENSQSRFLVGSRGTLGRFDYDTALLYSEARATDTSNAFRRMT